MAVMEKLSRICVGAAFFVLMAAVMVQVIGRTIGASPVWTEELTRFALLYLTAFGAGVSLMTGDLVNVDIVCDNLPGRWPRRLKIVSALATAALAALLIAPAWRYTSIGAMQTSPAMAVRMDVVHASMLVLLLSLMAFALVRAVRLMRGDDAAAEPAP